MSLSNAEKGRQYGKKLGEYKNKKFGVVGELRYHMKHQIWAITVGDVAVKGGTQDEVEILISEQLDALSKVKWYKVIRVEFKEDRARYGRELSEGVAISVDRHVVAKMPNKSWRAIQLKVSNHRDEQVKLITTETLFSDEFVVDHEFAMSQNYANYYVKGSEDVAPEDFPVTHGKYWHDHTATTYMFYDENTWDKLKLMVETLTKARSQINRLLTVGEDTGFIPLIEVTLTHGNNILVSGEENG